MKAIQRGAIALVGLSLMLTACGGNTPGTPSTAPGTTAGTTAGTTTESPGTGESTGTGEVDYGGVTEINLYSAFNKGTPLGTLQEQLIKAYTEKTGIKVNVSDAVGDQAMEAYEAQVAAGKQADVVIINPTNKARDWVKNGAVVDATEYLDKWGIKDKLTDGALDGWYDKDGKLLGLPYNGFEWPVYWNTKLLKEAGVDKVPATSDELFAAAEKMKAAGKPLFVTGGGDWTGQAVFFHVMNAYAKPETMIKVWQEGGYCSTPEVMKGIEYFVEMRDKGVFINDVEGYMMDQQNQTFFTGGAAAMSGGSWWFEDVPEAMRADIELGGIPVPADGFYKKPLAAHGSTSGGFWISENGAKKEAAVRAFVEMFYEQEWASKAVSETSTITVVKMDPAPELKNPLLAQAVTELPSRVDYLPMLDFEMPASVQAQNPSLTAQAYNKGTTAAQICAAIDGLY